MYIIIKLKVSNDNILWTFNNYQTLQKILLDYVTI